MDVASCILELGYTCASDAAGLAAMVAGSVFGDSCHGHASPYHFHVSPDCEFSPNSNAPASAVSAHSSLIGVALDGRGLYGSWEGAGGALPSLDACGGHVGPVPGTASATTGGVLGAVSVGNYAASSVYHYHVSASYPYTLGCFGGTAAVAAPISLAACMALYPGMCNTYIPALYPNGSAYFWDDWCPCSLGGSLPATAINTVPTAPGATCYSSFSGNSMRPSSTAGTVACSTQLLRTTNPGSTPSPTPSPASTNGSSPSISTPTNGAAPSPSPQQPSPVPSPTSMTGASPSTLAAGNGAPSAYGASAALFLAAVLGLLV